nr:hypothetical protein BaRGS_034948 [Batillaria attramentaria]
MAVELVHYEQQDLSKQLAPVVALDLLHNIGDSLRMSDTTLQRKVMCWKYKMLNHKYDFEDLKSNLDRIRKAFTNAWRCLCTPA